MWTRPVLCRLCECPASDGGVRVDQLDAEKLSKWWHGTIGVEFEPDETKGQEEVICQFCLWDARLEHENSVDKSTCGVSDECNWWSGLDNDKFFSRFYHQDELIQQCRVELGPEESKNQNEQFSSRPFVINQTESASKKTHKCLICASVMSSTFFLVKHMEKFHAGQFVQCKINGYCARVFVTEEEKMKHVQKDHASIKKCEFCHRMYHCFDYHMSTHHKNLVRCSYRKCRSYFRSEEEMQKHIAVTHTATPDTKMCIFCNLYYSNNFIRKHMRQMHKSQLASAFKCPHCHHPKYFLSQAKLKNHIDCCHKSKCIYCNKKFASKISLYRHLDKIHEDVKIKCRFRGCSQYFHSRVECESHFKQLHGSEEEKKILRCSKCSFRSCTNKVLKNHKNRMHGTKNLLCPKCGKCFCNLISLKQHLLSHEQTLCQYCNTQIQIRSANPHRRQTKCENCQLVLLCVQSANMHKKICIDK